MHKYIRPWWIAVIACACCAGSAAQQPPPLNKRLVSAHAVAAANTLANHADLAARQNPPPVTGAATRSAMSAAQRTRRPHVVAASASTLPSVATSVARPANGHATLTAAALRTAEKFHLDPAALRSGSVKAVVDGHAEVVNADTVAAKAALGSVFVTRTSATATRIALPSSLRAALPAGAPTSAVQLGYTLSATAAGAQRSRVPLVAIISNNTGLVLDAAHSAYRGGFSVALSNPADPTDRRALIPPITVSITAAGASEVSPAPLEIADVGGWHAVHVTVPDFPGDIYRVAVSADPQDPGNAIDLPVAKPTIQVIATPEQIPGWGIGQTVITVRARGLVAPDGYPVTLRSEHGSLEPAYAKLDAEGVATARLRSDSATSTHVRVGDAGVLSEPATVTFEPPWWFLAAAIAGGLLGAFIRGKGRRRAWQALAIGVASAVLMTLAYAVGIDWVGRVVPASRLATSGEAVVFVLGALAALVGVGALLPATGKGKGKGKRA